MSIEQREGSIPQEHLQDGSKMPPHITHNIFQINVVPMPVGGEKKKKKQRGGKKKTERRNLGSLWLAPTLQGLVEYVEYGLCNMWQMRKYFKSIFLSPSKLHATALGLLQAVTVT